jgi:uncharacterized membrane protein YfcA
LGAWALDRTTIPVLAVIFLATVIRSAFGFGEALVAVPLLALIIPVEVAVPLAVLISVTVAGLILAQDWREVHLGDVRRLVVSTLPGIPLGLLLLVTVAEPTVKALLAAVIIAFATYRLLGRGRYELRDDRLAWLFGLVAGVLGGAYGMNGPPLVVYGALRRWSPAQFRATLQGYFLPASLAGMFGYWLAGLWVPSVTRYYLLSLPVVLAATLLGRALNRRIDGRRFLLYVHLGLIAIGAVLLLQAASGPAGRRGPRRGATPAGMDARGQSHSPSLRAAAPPRLLAAGATREDPGSWPSLMRPWCQRHRKSPRPAGWSRIYCCGCTKVGAATKVTCCVVAVIGGAIIGAATGTSCIV